MSSPCRLSIFPAIGVPDTIHRCEACTCACACACVWPQNQTILVQKKNYGWFYSSYPVGPVDLLFRLSFGKLQRDHMPSLPYPTPPHPTPSNPTLPLHPSNPDVSWFEQRLPCLLTHFRDVGGGSLDLLTLVQHTSVEIDLHVKNKKNTRDSSSNRGTIKSKQLNTSTWNEQVGELESPLTAAAI